MNMKHNKIIIFVVVLSIFICISYSFYFHIRPIVDAAAYDKIAVNLVLGNGYREQIALPLTNDTAMVRAGPLYNFFLAGIYFAFGHRYGVVWIIQALLHGLTALFIYLICKNIFEHKGEIIGIIAAVLFAFHPDLIEISAMLMTETLYLFLTVITISLFVYLYKKPTYLTAAFLGLSFGLAYLTRQTVIFFIPIFLYFFYRQKLLKYFLIFVFASIFILIPWVVRNYIVYQKFIPATVNGGYNLWIGNRLGSDGEQAMPKDVNDYIANNGAIEGSEKGKSEFYKFVWNHPLEFVKLCFLRTMKYFSLIRPMGFWFYQQGLGQFIFILSSAVYSAILFMLGLAGILLSLKAKNKFLYYLLAFTICAPTPIILTVVETRYRFQIYPFLAIFAGFYLIKFLRKGPFYQKAVFVSLAILILNSSIDALLSFEKIKERFFQFF